MAEWRLAFLTYRSVRPEMQPVVGQLRHLPLTSVLARNRARYRYLEHFG